MEFEGSEEFVENSGEPPVAFTIIIQRFSIDGEELLADKVPEKRVVMCVNEKEMEKQIDAILRQCG